MKYGFLYLLLFVSAACSRSVEHEQKHINNFKFSSFRWTIHDDTDTLSFQLFGYLEIEESGRYWIMRKDSFNGPQQYGSAVLQDSLRQLINTVLTGRGTEQITWTIKDGYIYNGPSYAIDYEIGNRRHFIKFILPQVPVALQPLFISMEYLLDTTATCNQESSDLSSYEAWLKDQSEPPPIPIRPAIKFEAP